MKKIIIAAIIIFLLIVGAGLVYFYGSYQGISFVDWSKMKTIVIKDRIGTSTIQSFKDSTYIINGQPITLVNGLAETEIAPGSAEKQITKYFGNEAYGDLNGDRIEDVVFLITQDNGGSGTFYYVVAALRTDNGYQGTNAIFLGDRIAPQSTQIQGSQVIVNYADRNPGEPFTVQPSVGVSKYFEVVCNQLVVQGQSPMPTCATPNNSSGNSEKITTTTATMLDYENDQYGFSFKYPAKANAGPYQDEVASNTPDFPTVNYAVLEQDNFFCVRPQGYGYLSQDIAFHKADGANSTNLCLEIQPVANEQQLLSLIRKEYGSGCRYNLTKTASSSTYDVNLIYDTKGIEDSSCFPAETYYVKYSPTKKEAAFWTSGQECQLRISGDNWDTDNCLDKTLADSFRFFSKQF